MQRVIKATIDENIRTHYSGMYGKSDQAKKTLKVRQILKLQV